MYSIIFITIATIIGALLGFYFGWVGLVIAIPLSMGLGFAGGMLDAQRR